MDYQIKRLERAQEEMEKAITESLIGENIMDAEPEGIATLMAVCQLVRAQNSLLIEQAMLIYEINKKLEEKA